MTKPRTPVPEWTGDVVRTMHLNRISAQDLADALGCSRCYISLILCGKRSPKNGETMIKEALNRIRAQRTSGKTPDLSLAERAVKIS